jgi:hypothetical protein
VTTKTGEDHRFRRTFAFLDEFLATQKDFATAVLAAAEPVLGAAGQAETAGTTARKAASTPSAKTTT